MLEAKIIIEAPELANAINNLAAAIGAAKVNPAAMVAPAAPHNPAAMVPPQTPAVPVANPTPAPSAPAPTPAPMPAPAPVANVPVTTPAPPVPLAQPPQYSVDQIMAAGASLMDAGKINELMNLLHSFGVQAVMDLKPEQLGAFATEMRKLGAQI